MLLKTALRRELGSLAGVVFSALFTILVTTMLVRMLGRAATGRVDPASVLPLLAFSTVNYLSILLVLTLYCAILIAFTRAWRDAEMVIWQANGLSIAAWIRPVMGFALPFAVLVGILSLVIAPWANVQSGEYQSRFEQRQDISRAAAGQFRESAGGNRVFFVESLDDEQTEVRNVFVTQQKGDDLTIVVSSSGRILVLPDEERFLVLEQGRRYDGAPSAGDFRMMSFDRYGLRLEPQERSSATRSTKALGTLDLIADPTPRNLGELTWRVAQPVSAILLALLAIPLASVNPRMGRSINLVIALLIYVVYNNLMTLTQAWVAQERLPFSIGVWASHACIAVVVGWMYFTRTRLPRRSLWRWLPARSRRAA